MVAYQPVPRCASRWSRRRRLVKYLDGFFPIHADNQWQLRVPPFPAKALEVEESKYIISSYYLGGGSGSRRPAFGNAVFVATGTRVRDLPIRF